MILPAHIKVSLNFSGTNPLLLHLLTHSPWHTNNTRNLFEKRGCWDHLNLRRISSEKIFQ